MSVLFQYKDRYYGSLPDFPIKVGSKVYIVRKSVGLLYEGVSYLKQVATVTNIYYPGSTDHAWWSICHTIDYVIPSPDDILIKAAFDSGISDIFLPYDMVNVFWLPTDRLPTMEEAIDFGMYLPPNSYI